MDAVHELFTEANRRWLAATAKAKRQVRLFRRAQAMRMVAEGASPDLVLEKAALPNFVWRCFQATAQHERESRLSPVISCGHERLNGKMLKCEGQVG